ncbi:MAG: hydrogenase maturation protease [Bacteroidales bacterium]|nr:hydrogenase maturation protease [Bacteroidales bacterium]
MADTSVYSGSVLMLGIGNEILTDDGIGPKLIHDLDKNQFPDHVVYQVASLGGLELLEIIKDFDTVFILDAIRTLKNDPGTVYCYTPDDFKETLHLSNLHDINFLTALELGRRTGMRIPSTIIIIAIEIVEDREFSTFFSPVIQKRYSEILSKVQRMLEEFMSVPMI